MYKIKITTDSVSDLGQELMELNGIDVMPLTITLGNESFPDNQDMPKKIFEYVEKTGILPKTAARSIPDYIDFFNKNIQGYDGIVHFCISKELSASYSVACLASEQCKNVYIVDTESLSTGSGLNVLYACNLAKQGELSASEIAKKCQDRAKYAQASFVLDNLDYLHKGGRCSGVTKFMASVLKIKPMINLKNGFMLPGKKYKGKFEKAITNYVNDIMNQYDTPDLNNLFITYTTAPDGMAEAVKEQVLARYQFKNVHITNAGGTVTSHCGTNTLGILYFNDGDKI